MDQPQESGATPFLIAALKIQKGKKERSIKGEHVPLKPKPTS